jgi:hypothetical protein
MAEAVVAVVGAGITGLACAAALGPGAAAVVFDRVPVAGGVHGWEAGETRRLERRARAVGATLRLGVTATTWDGAELVGMGQDGVERVRAAVLVVAAGARPRGRAELQIAGDRPAGVVAATVACHLAENGLPVGLRPAVLGGGDWAVRSAQRLLEAGAHRVTVIAPDGMRLPPPGGAVEVRERRTVSAVRGGDRVEVVDLDDGSAVGCDALVLAHGLVPLRNVDGAVDEGPAVIYAQPVDDPGSVAGAERAGAVAAAEAMAAIRKESG